MGFLRQWDFSNNGISPCALSPSQLFPPWALSQCHIYHNRATAALSPGGQSHSRPGQDFRTDLSLSPNSPQGPVTPGKAAGSAPSGSVGSQARPELSLSEVSAPAASGWCFLGLQNSTNHTRITGTTLRNWGRDSGRVLAARKYPWRLLSALPKMPVVIPTPEHGWNPGITGSVQPQRAAGFGVSQLPGRERVDPSLTALPGDFQPGCHGGRALPTPQFPGKAPGGNPSWSRWWLWAGTDSSGLCHRWARARRGKCLWERGHGLLFHSLSAEFPNWILQTHSRDRKSPVQGAQGQPCPHPVHGDHAWCCSTPKSRQKLG